MNDTSAVQKANLAIEASGAPSKWLYTVFALSAILGISGWLFLIGIFIFWTLEDVKFPTIKEPIPVLNENNEVAIGDELLMTFDITKLVDIAPIGSARYLECQSGNLVTLTSSPINLPVGTYTVTARSVTIPNKLSVGDVCTFVIQATYEVNPLKKHTDRFQSEPFTIIKKTDS